MPLPTISEIAYNGISFLLGAATTAGISTLLRRKEDREQFQRGKRVAYLEEQLSRLYWPLYLHLQKDNLIWEKLLDRQRNPQDTRTRLSEQIERDVILPNHKSAVETIEANIHLAGDAEVVDFCLRYVKHVKVYESLRAAGIKDDPLNFGEPYPGGLFPIIESRTKQLQSEYDTLIERAGSTLGRENTS